MVAEDPALVFTFGVPEELSLPILQLDGAWFSYTGDKNKFPSPNSPDWVLKDVDLSVDLQSHIAVSFLQLCFKMFQYTSLLHRSAV